MLNPIAFSLGPIHVHWYGIIIGTGAVIGMLLAIQEGKRFGIKPDFFMDLLLIGAPMAIIGARIYYVAFEWNTYRQHPSEIYKIWHGGIAIYGAILAALIVAVVYTRRKGVGFWRIVDICAPSLLFGQMMGRWGNFMNQEAHGGPVSESFLRHTLHLPNFIVNQMYIEGQYYHPTFLYESAWSLLGIIFLLWLRRRRSLLAGELFMAYLIWYSFGRFFVEGVRTDSLVFAGPQWLADWLKQMWYPMHTFGWGAMEAGKNIRISQLLAVVLIVLAIVFILVRRLNRPLPAHYLDPIVFRAAQAEAVAQPAGDTARDSDVEESAEDASQAQAAEEPADDASQDSEVRESAGEASRDSDAEEPAENAAQGPDEEDNARNNPNRQPAAESGE